MNYMDRPKSVTATTTPQYGAGLQQGIEPERTSHVQSASISLEAAIEDVLNKVTALEKRLYPILRPCPPDAQNDAKEVVQFVPLAEGLRNFSARVNSCSAQLSSILERIEL